MSKNTQETHSLKKLIEDVDDGYVKLPEFQRDFVWDVEKTLDLFDSIVKDIFIGAIIYGIPSFDITIRQLDNRPRKTKGKRRKSLETKSYTKEEIKELHNISKDRFRIILDGQQRTTSIYRALKGVDHIWFVIKNDDELEEEVMSRKFNDRKLEDILYEFDRVEDDSRLSIKLSDVWDIMQGDYFEEEIRERFFSSLKFVSNKNAVDFDQKRVFRKFLVVIKKIQTLLQAEKLLSYYKLDMSLDKFVLFFERSNNQGVQLSFIDILTAKLYNKFRLRRKIQEAEANNPDFKIDVNTLVRAIAFLKSSENRAETGKSIKIHKSFILSELSSDDFVEWWDDVVTSYKEVNEFLFNNKYTVSQKWIPYETMIIPLIIFRKELGKPFSSMNRWQSDFIDYWWWASIFSLRYSGSTNEKVIEDSLILTQIANNKRIANSSFFSKISKSQVLGAEDLFGFNSKVNPVYKGILNMCNYHNSGIIEWGNGNMLSFNSDKLEDHHIFPKAFLTKIYDEGSFEEEHINCVVNRALIPKIQNIKISNKAPSVYFNELRKENSKLLDALSKHFIDKDTAVELLNGKLDEDYKWFLEVRSTEIFEAIETNVINKHESILSNYYEEEDFNERSSS